MGVYVKGAKMPSACTGCKWRPLVGCNPYKDNGLSPSDHRHRDCQLVKVATPHGRLIDADALVNTVMHTNIPADTKEFIEDLIGIAPTVIEAEEG